MKKYIKKINVYSAESSVEARAERLRRLRNMANLTRDEMCNVEGLNVNTYKGWEIARYGGLPADGAHKVISRVTQEGVVCNPDWLLHGVGMSPYVLPEYQKPFDFSERPEFKAHSEKDYILHEIQFFKQHFPKALFCKIEDDAMAPTYKAGDFVAGVPCHKETTANLIGEICIVETEAGVTLVRQIQHRNTLNQFTLGCTNPKTTASTPSLQNVVLVSAAPIARMYRKTD